MKNENTKKSETQTFFFMQNRHEIVDNYNTKI